MLLGQITAQVGYIITCVSVQTLTLRIEANLPQIQVSDISQHQIKSRAPAGARKIRKL